MQSLKIVDETAVHHNAVKTPRGASFKSKLFIALAVLCLASSLFVAYDTDATHNTTEDVFLSEYPVVDPEVKIVTAYQKARYSTMAIEIAELQATVLVETAHKYELPVSLVVGVADQESMFNARSTSSVGATGLFQLYALEGITIDENRRYDLRYNADTGCKGLRIKYKKAGYNWTKALSMYSGYAEDYADKVYARMGRYIMFKEGYNFAAKKEVAQLTEQLKTSVID